MQEVFCISVFGKANFEIIHNILILLGFYEGKFVVGFWKMESFIRAVLIVLLFHFGCADVVRDYEIQKHVWSGSSNGNGSETHLHTISNGQKCLSTNVWFVWDNQSQSCHCGSDLNGVVMCDTNTKELLVLKWLLSHNGTQFSTSRWKLYFQHWKFYTFRY